MHRWTLIVPSLLALTGCARTVRPVVDDAATAPTVPRQIAPLSTAVVTSRHPRLHWLLGPGDDGARVEICRDRACTQLITTLDATGTSAAPTDDLPTGVVYWRLHGRSGMRVDDAVSPTWQFTVGARSAAVDTSWGTTLDVNGDGFADVAVGARLGNIYATMNIYFGSARGLAATPSAMLVGDPAVESNTYGSVVASAGDVDGDGFADLAVAAPISDPGIPSRVYIYRGGASGVATTATTVLEGPAGGQSLYGALVASAGDVDGDGYADLAVFAPQNVSRILVYRGSANGLIPTPASMLTPSTANLEPDSLSIGSAGDVNGDGFGDLLAGIVNGHTYVYLGSDHGLPDGPSLDLLVPGETGGVAGCAGDVNGDGYADLVVGSSDSVVVARVYAGSATGPSMAVSMALGSPDTGRTVTPTTVAGAGDVNGDGFGDIVAGTPGLPGHIGVFLGRPGGPAATFSADLVEPIDPAAPPESQWFGASVLGAGDVDGDGLADMLVGAYGRSPTSGTESTTVPGHVYLFRGGASGIESTPAFTLTGPGDRDAAFGISVASARAATTARPRS